MRVRLLAVLLAFLVGSGCLGSSDQPASVRHIEARVALPHGMGLIEGYVVNETFATLPGASVHVRELDLHLRTNEAGYFSTGAITPGRYRLAVQNTGYSDAARWAQATAGEASLYVFVLDGILLPREYQVRQQQTGLVFCQIAATVPENALVDGRGEAKLDCTPAGLDSAMDRQGGSPRVLTMDQSQRRWLMDEPEAEWRDLTLRTQWSAGQELARHLMVSFAIEGCRDAARSFGKVDGSSPLRQSVQAADVDRVLSKAEGSTCGDPGERCDRQSCALETRVGVGARSLPLGMIAAGGVVQQVFDQELSAAFGRVAQSSGQTLK